MGAKRRVNVSKIRVMVIDDSSQMRYLVKSILDEMGFSDFVEARDGDQAISMLAEEGAQLIICDWNMPNVEGIEVLKWLRAQPDKSATPFIMLTGEAQQENIIAAVREGATQYVIKPFTADLLTQKVLGVLATHRF